MKKTLLLVAFCAILTSFSTSIFAQNSCPVIITNTFRITADPASQCGKRIVFDYNSPSSGAKRIKVEVKLNNTVIFTDCIDATDKTNGNFTYNSAYFTLCSLSGVIVSITPLTGSQCNGAPCSPTLISIAGAPLPVSFSSFTASRLKDVVELKWQTSTEINNKGFEKNTNGTWEEVAFVNSQALNGNSSDLLNYNYRDLNSNTGMTQYRLKQTDIDGHSKYSEVRAIQGLGKNSKTVLFPNPSNDGKVNIVFDAATERDIMIMDMSGRILRQYKAYTSNSIQVANLVAGMYTVRSINTDNGSITMDKFVVAAH